MKKGNKNKVLYIILVVLLAITIYFIKTSSNTTIKGRFSNFAIADTAAITKIFMVNKTGKKVLLERKKGYWEVNRKYKTRKDAIDVLLQTMKDIKVKEPIAKSALETEIKRMSVKSVKVEIYTDGKEPIKTYYVEEQQVTIKGLLC
jgi:hypothetical protein